MGDDQDALRCLPDRPQRPGQARLDEPVAGAAGCELVALHRCLGQGRERPPARRALAADALAFSRPLPPRLSDRFACGWVARPCLHLRPSGKRALHRAARRRRTAHRQRRVPARLDERRPLHLSQPRWRDRAPQRRRQAADGRRPQGLALRVRPRRRQPLLSFPRDDSSAPMARPHASSGGCRSSASDQEARCSSIRSAD